MVMGALQINDHCLRERYRAGGETARQARAALDTYYQLLADAFPITGEIEAIDAYDEYLTDPNVEWDIIVLSDASSERIIGGIQWQIIRHVNVPWLDTLAWVEHVWLVDEPRVRNYHSFHRLLATIQKHMRERRVYTGFMEFNDPEKMNPEQIALDASGGLSSWERLLLWAHAGIHDLVYSAADGRQLPVPYAQPSMDGGPPVRFLSIGFFTLVHELSP